MRGTGDLQHISKLLFRKNAIASIWDHIGKAASAGSPALALFLNSLSNASNCSHGYFMSPRLSTP